MPVRLEAIEEAALSALQSRLLTPDLAKVFVEEFAREVSRLAQTRGEREEALRVRLAELGAELRNLSANLLAGVVSSTLMGLLADREAEKARLEAELASRSTPAPQVLAHPVLLRRFEEKMRGIREALNDPSVRTEAAQTMRSLVEVITIHVEDGVAVAEVESSISTLIDFAQNAEDPPPPGRWGSFCSGGCGDSTHKGL